MASAVVTLYGEKQKFCRASPAEASLPYMPAASEFTADAAELPAGAADAGRARPAVISATASKNNPGRLKKPLTPWEILIFLTLHP
jgi:hypothetical protein